MKLHHFRGLLIAAGTTICTFTASAQDITGAGATFPAPAYAKWAGKRLPT